jgi:ribosomal protein S18 acetylase RimI-like enzyme
MQKVLWPPAPAGAKVDSSTVLVCGLSEFRDVARVLPGVQALLHEAGNPYFDWLFGSSEGADAAIAAWMRRPQSELAIDRIRIALVDGELVGMYLALSGLALRGCRQADTVALLAETGRSGAARTALVERVEASKELFARVSPDEFYLSKIGVVGEHRGKGLGRALMLEYLAGGRKAGFSSFRLDVAAENEPAIRLYRTLGFGNAPEREAAGMRYLPMTAAVRPTDSPPSPAEAA